MEQAGITLRSLFCGSPPPEAASEVSGWSLSVSFFPALSDTETTSPFTLQSLPPFSLPFCPPRRQLCPCCVPFLSALPLTLTSLPVTSTPLLSGSNKVGEVGIR